ncbi:hypothetical protein PRIPAC_95308 [Pristionchus pacificus]|uniref:Nuclear receptor n=1 Tax=Pristionchus pacificus TaxID=54126 RepID=A0A2A6D2W5_PRIPA|nr:hypothetical protein PRIPAC_95308 [Pristionchus pacificus]|eukprot:PDM84633.1 nuclear receptor [Pristionchus pacificus]
MSGKRKTECAGLKCLICGADTLHAHSGIDSCRACSVFYKRTIDRESELVCISGNGTCGTKGNIVSCRKCRLERFKEVLNRASSVQISCDVERRLEEESTEELANEIPDFPNAEAQARKSGEMGGLHHMRMHEQMKMRSAPLRPTKYSDMVPYSQIFFGAMIDFAEEAFPDFNKLSAEDGHALLRGNFQLILAIDSAYRSHHNFPNDETVMATYLTYVSDDSLPHFMKYCPPEVNKDAAVEEFRKNMKGTTILAKIDMGKASPSVDEFMVLFGFALWNDCSCSLDTEIANLVKKNREEILRELKIVYSRKGCVEYTPRMGELLILLASQEGAVERTKEDVQMYRVMNLFNEAYEEEK